MKRSILSTSLVLLIAFALIAAISGCSGEGIDFNVWAGSYSGTGTLDNDKVGNLALTCGSDGLVSGTLTVTGVDGTDEDFKFTAGTYDLNGSITSTGGNFEVSGNVPDNGNFFIRGRFPTDGSSKTYTVVTEASEEFPDSLTYTGELTHD
jgi:hypothetical protein